MKKSLYLLVTATLVFAGVVTGVFLGRNSIETIVSLDPFTGNKPSPTISANETATPGKININKASANELMLLPGIGSVKATAIIEFRETYGDFRQIEELLYLDGFSNTLLETLRPYITVGG